MPKIIEIGITNESNKEIEKVKFIEVVAGKGIKGDRYFYDINEEKKQLTLIESENIDYYNKEFQLNIPYLNFRRNIVTKGIKLNDLIDKKILIGEIEVKGINLCRPCKHLEQTLEQNNIIKEFLRKGGLRCEILNSGKISINDKITLI